MEYFQSFVLLLDAIALIAVCYLGYKWSDILDRKLAEAIRKQDDRLRKRFETSNGRETNADPSADAELPSEGVRQGRGSKNTAGRPYRR